MKRAETWVLATAAASLTSLLAVLPAASQPVDDLRAQIQRLQRDTADLQREVFRNQPPRPGVPVPPPALEPTPPVSTATTQRVDDIEESLRRVTGQLEELSHQLDQMSQKNDRLQRQVEFLEKSRLTGPPPPEENGDALAFTSPQPPAVLVPVPGTFPAQPSLRAPDAGPAVIGSIREPAAPRPPAPVANPPSANLATGSLAPGNANSPEAEYDAAMGLLARAQYERARESFRVFADTHAGNELSATALYWKGDIAYSMQRNYAGAARDFAELLKKYPAAPRAPEGMLKLGLSLLALGQKQEGCAALAALPAKYPNANPTIVNRSRVERRTVGCA